LRLFYYDIRRRIESVTRWVGPRAIKNGLKSLWYWFPVIWQDRDFDYFFTLHVLRHSLKKLERGMYRRKNTKKTNLKELRIAILLLDRIIYDDYTSVCGKLDEPCESIFGLDCTDYSNWRKIEESDWAYLWPLLQKYMRVWWD